MSGKPDPAQALANAAEKLVAAEQGNDIEVQAQACRYLLMRKGYPPVEAEEWLGQHRGLLQMDWLALARVILALKHWTPAQTVLPVWAQQAPARDPSDPTRDTDPYLPAVKG